MRKQKIGLGKKLSSAALVAGVALIPVLFSATAANAAPDDAYISSVDYTVTPAKNGTANVLAQVKYYAGSNPDSQKLVLPPMVRIENDPTGSVDGKRYYEYSDFKTPANYMGHTVANGGEKAYNPWTVISIDTNDKTRQTLTYSYTLNGAVSTVKGKENFLFHVLDSYNSSIPVQRVTVNLEDSAVKDTAATVTTGKTESTVTKTPSKTGETFTIIPKSSTMNEGEIVLNASYAAGTFDYASALKVKDKNAVAAQDAPKLIDGVSTIPLTAAQQKAADAAAAESAYKVKSGFGIAGLTIFIIVLAFLIGSKAVRPKLKKFANVPDGVIPASIKNLKLEKVETPVGDAAIDRRTPERVTPPSLNGDTLPPAFAIVSNDHEYKTLGNAFTATILDLANRGYLSLTEISTANGKEIVVNPTDKSTLGLAHNFEREIVKEIAGIDDEYDRILGGKSTTLSKIVFRNFITNIESDLTSSNFFVKNRGLGETLTSILFFVGAVALGAGILQIILGASAVFVALNLITGVGLTVSTVVSRSRVRSDYSPLGYALAVQSDGFRKYLEGANKKNVRSIEGRDMNGSYLTWCLAYGIAENWFSAFSTAPKSMWKTEAPVTIGGSTVNLSVAQLSFMSNILNQVATRRSWGFEKEYNSLTGV